MAPDNRPVPESVWRSSWLSAILAVILVLEVIGVATYGYFQVRQMLAPESLADRAEATLRESYPEIRQQILQDIQNEAPQIAEQVSQDMVESTPEARQWLEQFTARQLKTGLDRAAELSAAEFRDVLKENHDTIAEAFEKLETAPAEAHELIRATEASMERQLGVDIQEQAKAALSLHENLNDKLARLNDPSAELSDQELLERRIVRTLKTIQVQTLEQQATSDASPAISASPAR